MTYINIFNSLSLLLFVTAEVMESSSSYSSTTGSKSTMQASSESHFESSSFGSAGMVSESQYESSSTVSGALEAGSKKKSGVSISEVHGEDTLTSSQVAHTLNTSTTDKTGSLAVSGGKPFFSKPLHGHSVERKCYRK